jgi:hypothetical protein
MFALPYLNLFLSEELVLNGITSSNLVKLDEIEIEKQDGGSVSFRTAIFNAPGVKIHWSEDISLDRKRSTSSYTKIMEPIYDQLINLLIDPKFELNQLVQLGSETPTLSQLKQVLSEWKYDNTFNLDVSSSLLVSRLYDNLAQYSNSNEKVNPESQLQHVSFYSSYHKGKEKVDVQLHLVNPTIHKKSLLERLDDRTLLNLNSNQIVSLYRLIWAVQTINKIRYSINTKSPVVIYLDNMELQMAHLKTGLHATKLNLDLLSAYQISPNFDNFVQNKPFEVLQWFRYTYENNRGSSTTGSDYSMNEPISSSHWYSFMEFQLHSSLYLNDETSTDQMVEN